MATVRVIHVGDLADSVGASAVASLVSSFSCPPNSEVETFLKRNALDFTKRSVSVTHLLVSPEDRVCLGVPDGPARASFPPPSERGVARSAGGSTPCADRRAPCAAGRPWIVASFQCCQFQFPVANAGGRNHWPLALATGNTSTLAKLATFPTSQKRRPTP